MINIMKNIDNKLSVKSRIIIVTIIETLIIILNILDIVYLNHSQIDILMRIAIILFTLMLTINSVVDIKKLIDADLHLKNLESYNKTLKNLNDNVRCFKHDFNNIIQALGGYIRVDDMEGLREYYKDIFKDCKSVNNLEILNQENFNNPAIYNIVNNKALMCRGLGIEMNISVLLDLNELKLPTYEISRILGILLDNAIEAARECENKIINLEFVFNSKKNMQLIKIENTYKEKDIDVDKIYEKGYSSKKGNTGLGLWKVRQIMKKHTNANLFTSKDETYFKQQLEMYL